MRASLSRALRRVREDLREDPYLKYVLALAVVLAGFWCWHRVPNFATRDERDRLMDVLVAYGKVAADPSFESVREGVLWSRKPFGATVYLFGLAVLPVFAVAVLTGNTAAFAPLATPQFEFGYYPTWLAVPGWVWTGSLLAVRLSNVALAVGSVYLTYRLGVAVRDRATGRLGALLVTLSFGFLTLAKEGGEDVPALFFLLLALVLLVEYVQRGSGRAFLAACLFGGIAIAFKFTAAPVVVVIALAHALRARRAEADWQRVLWRPGFVFAGALTGLLAILLGLPTFVLAGPGPIVERMAGSAASRVADPNGPDAPTWWWLLRGALSAFGLPLALASAAGITASLVRLRRGDGDTEGQALVFAALALFIALVLPWHDFRVHHLLPVVPLAAVLTAGSLVYLCARRPAAGRVAIAAVLVTTAIYAGVGTAQYATMPRDEARAWLTENADGATLETYRRDVQDGVVPRTMTVQHAYGYELPPETLDSCPDYIHLGYRDLLYLKAGTYFRNDPERAAYVRALLAGEYNYTVAAEFGPRPPEFVPDRARPGNLGDLLRYGIVPQTDQYADEQELSANQYTVILERNGSCPGPGATWDGERPYPPF